MLRLFSQLAQTSGLNFEQEKMEGNIGIMCLLTVGIFVIVCVADLHTIL